MGQAVTFTAGSSDGPRGLVFTDRASVFSQTSDEGHLVGMWVFAPSTVPTATLEAVTSAIGSTVGRDAETSGIGISSRISY